MSVPLRIRRRVAASAAAALLLWTAAAAPAGAADLPVGSADGVRIERDGGAAVVVFSKAAAPLYKRIAGKRVEVECTHIATGGGLWIAEGDSSGSELARAPRRRAPLRTGMNLRGSDFCRVWLAAGKSGSRRLIVSVPLTQKGAAQLDEERRFTLMNLALVLAGDEGDKRRPAAWPTPAALVDSLVGRLRPLRRTIVALDSADATPPADTVGYWSDGARHVAVVALSSLGRRMFVEFDADDVFSTNVAQFLGGE